MIVNGLIITFIESRLLNFFVNLFRFFLTLAMVLATDEQLATLMICAIVLLIPLSFIASLQMSLALGNALKVTDDDLKRIFGLLKKDLKDKSKGGTNDYDNDSYSDSDEEDADAGQSKSDEEDGWDVYEKRSGVNL